ncbi:MAG: hypothetical protein BZ151_09530 [Desulfobacca sp. 4484_104]|nr:MAG: hypothetical protein BZ151_09530 [Desulfobacca sp. 4484_104]
MSNVSTVTPYHSTSSGPGVGSALAGAVIGLAGACVVGAVAGSIVLARWLAEETPAERQARERAQAQRRRERLQSAPRQLAGSQAPEPLARPAGGEAPIVSAALHLRQAESLVRSAEKLGYRPEPLVQPQASLPQPPYLCLRGPSGERVAIEPRPEGGLLLHTVQQPQRLQTLIRQHTLDQVVSHLQRAGHQVQTTTMTNGETQILAREQNPHLRGGAAEVKAQIATDGTVWVDINRVRGNRCEEIVQGIAQAMGGQVTGMKKKDAYFQMPGEPTRTKMRV